MTDLKTASAKVMLIVGDVNYRNNVHRTLLPGHSVTWLPLRLSVKLLFLVARDFKI